MPKLLKSEHLNKELWKAGQELKDADEKGTLKLGVKIGILIAKLIRDIRHNQVEIMKKMGIALSTTKKSYTVSSETGENTTDEIAAS